MWRTDEGERVLKDAEWELFRMGLSTLWDDIEMELGTSEAIPTGVEVFDHLQPNQKLALLALAGAALRDKDCPAPDLTAFSEGTVAAIFKHICSQVEFEIELSPNTPEDPKGKKEPTTWRSLVRKACRESKSLPRRSLPAKTSWAFDDWQMLIDILANQILWDDGDYEMEDIFMDLDPEVSRTQMKAMGIDPDYYLALAPDPSDNELVAIRAQLRGITGRPQGWVVR